MTTIASIDVALGARSTQLEQRLRSSERSVRRWGSTTGRTLQRTARIAGTAAAAANGVFAATAKASLKQADSIAKSARNADLATDAYQGLVQVFELTGAGGDNVEKAVAAMNVQIRNLRLGLSTAKDLFTDLEISPDDIANRSTLELMRERLSQIEDAGERSAIAQLVFGRAGKQAGTLLQESSEDVADSIEQLDRLVVEHTCNDVSVVAGVFLARRGREVVPGSVERAQRGEGRTGDHPKGAPTNAHLLCCRLSTYARYAFEATPRIWTFVNALTRHYKCVRPLGGCLDSDDVQFGVYQMGEV